MVFGGLKRFLFGTGGAMSSMGGGRRIGSGILGGVPKNPLWVLSKNLDNAVALSRDGVYRNPYLARFIDLSVVQIVGKDGFLFNAKVMYKDKMDNNANESLEKNWKKWTNTADITGKTWLDFQQSVARSYLIDGEVFCRFVNNGKQIGLQLIDTQRIPTNYNDSNRNIVQGIKYDDWGLPVSYFVSKSDVNTMTMGYSHSRNYVEIKADDMLHVANVKAIGQGRGLPVIASVLDTAHMLNEYTKATVDNAIASAKMTGFIENKDGETETDGTDFDPTSGQQSLSLDSPVIQSLPMGATFNAYNPQFPENQLGEFVKVQLQKMASGLGINYSSLSNDLQSVNFSSLRQGTLEQRDTYKVLQSIFINGIFMPVYHRWLERNLLIGIPVANSGKKLTRNIEVYKDVEFLPRPYDWIDPVKDVNAKIAEINNGLKSRHDVVRESGRDPQAVDKSIANVAQSDEKLGIMIGDKESDTNDQNTKK